VTLTLELAATEGSYSLVTTHKLLSKIHFPALKIGLTSDGIRTRAAACSAVRGPLPTVRPVNQLYDHIGASAQRQVNCTFGHMC
jgi:hypothetical protein